MISKVRVQEVESPRRVKDIQFQEPYWEIKKVLDRGELKVRRENGGKGKLERLRTDKWRDIGEYIKRDGLYRSGEVKHTRLE